MRTLKHDPGSICKACRSYDAGLFEHKHVKMVGREEKCFKQDLTHALLIVDYLISQDHEPIAPPVDTVGCY